MTITLQPKQERAIEAAIRRGAIRSVDEFIDAAIANLPIEAPESSTESGLNADLWTLRRGARLDDVSIRELIDEGRE